MKRLKRFAADWVVPILAGVGGGAAARAVIESVQPPSTGSGWEGESPEDRAMINGIQQLMVEGVIDGRQVNELIKSGQLSDRVIFLLGDIHDPGAYVEPGEDASQLNAAWSRAYKNNGVEL